MKKGTKIFPALSAAILIIAVGLGAKGVGQIGKDAGEELKTVLK